MLWVRLLAYVTGTKSAIPPLSLRFKVGQVGQFHGAPNFVNDAKAAT
jgi:hypothetical protein